MNKNTVLIIEDDPAVCRAYVEYADRLDDVTLIGTTDDADEALKLVKDFLPQAIILDLELQRGGGSGLDVLRGIKQMDLPAKPFVLVVTINPDDIIQTAARRNGASYFISKRQRDYSEKRCLDFLRDLAEDIQSGYHSGPAREAISSTPAMRRERALQRIRTELNKIGIRNTVLGYKYLPDAIMLTIENPGVKLSEEIGKLYGTTGINAFHAMQNAIDRAWETQDPAVLKKHYTATISAATGVPRVTEFVFYYADLIKREYQL